MIRALAILGVSVLLAGGAELDRRTLRQAMGPAGPAPGVYKIRPLNLGGLRCLGVVSGAPFRENYLGAVSCQSADALIAIQPRGPEAYTLRPAGQLEGRHVACATIARGVVLGPAAIDVRECQSPGDARSYCDQGWFDQRFSFERVGPNVWRLFSGTGYSLALRDATPVSPQELIQWDREENANQKFELVYVGPITASEEARCVEADGWRGGVRALPVAGVNFYGGDYQRKDTADDGGRECARICAEDDRCRAFAWVRPGVQGPGAVCWLKDRIPPANADGNTAGAVVRP